MVIIVAWVCAVFACMAPLFENLVYFGICIWGFLFCGAFMGPALIGMMLTCVDKNLRSSANSICAFFQNSLSYMPAPFIYGLISDFLK
jgi:hypothetical protein